MTQAVEAGVYVNLGGVGFLSFGGGEVVPQHLRTAPLRLVATFGGQVIASEAAPAQGWDRRALEQALEKHRPVVLSFAPVDAIVGEEWIGGTEV